MKIYQEILFFVLLCIFSGQISAQSRLNFLPNFSHDNGNLITRCNCELDMNGFKPARNIELFYEIIGEGQFDLQSGISNTNNKTFRSRQKRGMFLDIPLIRKQKFNVSGGLLYQQELYDIKDLQIEDYYIFRTLHHSKFDFLRVHLKGVIPFANKFSLSTIGQYYFNSGAGIFDTKKNFNAIIVTNFIGYKINERHFVGLGIHQSKNYKSSQTIPVLVYKNNFGKYWGVDISFPYSAYLKSFRNERTIVSIGADYTSSSFIFSNPFLLHSGKEFDQSAVKGTVMIEKSVTKHFWFHAKIGYQSNFDMSFLEVFDPSHEPVKYKQTATPFFELSIFFSIPKKTNQ